MGLLELIITICVYILSLVLALLLGMAGKKFRNESIRLPLAFHLVLLSLTLIFFLSFPAQEMSKYLLLFSVCSGLSLSAWAIRNSSLNMLFRIYLASYLLSLFVFLWSPALLFYSISGNYQKFRNEQAFNLKDNYYLVEQQSMVRSLNTPTR